MTGLLCSSYVRYLARYGAMILELPCQYCARQGRFRNNTMRYRKFQSPNLPQPPTQNRASARMRRFKIHQTMFLRRLFLFYQGIDNAPTILKTGSWQYSIPVKAVRSLAVDAGRCYGGVPRTTTVRRTSNYSSRSFPNLFSRFVSGSVDNGTHLRLWVPAHHKVYNTLPSRLRCHNMFQVLVRPFHPISPNRHHAHPGSAGHDVDS